MTWTVLLSRQAVRDARNLSRAGLKPQAEHLLHILKQDPFQNPPRVEKLVGNLAGLYSRRINRQHRLVYRIDSDTRTVHVLRMWTHYE